MSRLIDADTLMDSLGIDDRDIYFKWLIEDAPTVDAVPVIRCKDCKWIDYCDTQEGKESLCCREGFPVDLNDFCSWGEKVTE